MEEAITAAYLGPRYCRGADGDKRPLVLCIYDSFDMCTFLRELLCSAGYNALTAGNVSDGRVLMKATKAKLVVISVAPADVPRTSDKAAAGGDRSRGVDAGAG